MFPFKNVEDLQKLNELVSSENQVKAIRLQAKLGEQKFHKDLKKVLEPVTKPIKGVSEDVTKTMTENSINNNKQWRI